MIMAKVEIVDVKQYETREVDYKYSLIIHYSIDFLSKKTYKFKLILV